MCQSFPVSGGAYVVAPGGGACVVAPGGACVVAQGGACVVAWGGMCGCSRGHAWLLWGGVCGCSQGGMRGCSWGGHAWLLGGGMCGCSWRRMHGCSQGGGMHGCSRGVCMVAPGGHVWLLPGGRAWDTTRYGDTVNERAVRILLECILVYLCIPPCSNVHSVITTLQMCPMGPFERINQTTRGNSIDLQLPLVHIGLLLCICSLYIHLGTASV